MVVTPETDSISIYRWAKARLTLTVRGILGIFIGRVSRSLLRGLCLALLLLWAPGARADVKVSRSFASSMVLQRDAPIPVFGTADAGEKVDAHLGKHSATVTAGRGGSWRLQLPAMKAGGPHDLIVKGTNTLRLRQVHIGDVWVCAGGKSMYRMVRQAVKHRQKIAKINRPQLALASVARHAAGFPQEDVMVRWYPARGSLVSGYSAIGYAFGVEIQNRLKVPVGLVRIHSPGPLDIWLPLEGLAAQPELAELHTKVLAARRQYANTYRNSLDAIEAWIGRAGRAIDERRLIPPMPATPKVPAKAASSAYNGMVHPLTPLPVRGILWSHWVARDQKSYPFKLAAVVSSWRRAWGRKDLPFFIVRPAPDPSAKGALPKQMWDPVLALPHVSAVDAGTPDLSDAMAVGTKLADLALPGTREKTRKTTITKP